jgi:anti-sigma factor RsiW
MRSSQAFAHQAALAHAVFSPEVRHPVEVGAAEQDHLVQWLSKRLGRPLKVPVLASQGYTLVGGRLLPGEGGARAQFMFQNAAGLRVTLYLGALDARPAAAGRSADAPGNRETAFRYSTDGPVPSFYWVDQGFGYALSGAVSREELMRLAQLVYRQL